MKYIAIDDIPNHNKIIVWDTTTQWNMWKYYTLLFVKMSPHRTDFNYDKFRFAFNNVVDNVEAISSYTFLYRRELKDFKFITLEDFAKYKPFI